MTTCPTCGGDAAPLGTLGRLAHFACRDCGEQSSRPAAADVEPGHAPDSEPS